MDAPELPDGGGGGAAAAKDSGGCLAATVAGMAECFAVLGFDITLDAFCKFGCTPEEARTKGRDVGYK